MMKASALSKRVSNKSFVYIVDFMSTKSAKQQAYFFTFLVFTWPVAWIKFYHNLMTFVLIYNLKYNYLY